MLKISEDRLPNGTSVCRLEGRIIGPWVGELLQICEPLVNNGRALALDLADVSFADENGLTLLLNLRTRGAQLVNVTPFVQEQLESTARG